MGTDPKQKNQYGAKGLHMAAGRGAVGLVVSLLDAGAELNSPDADGCTALHHAVMGDHRDTVRLLLHHGANRDVKDNKGRQLSRARPPSP